MRVAIISDIHANHQAWQAVLQDIKMGGIDSIVCLGDIVGYGPRPKQVLEEVTYRTENIILGNHDAVIGNRLDPSEFNENAHEAIDWTRSCLGDDSAKFFGGVPTIMQFDDVLCVHAEAAEPENWNYITNPELALPSFLSTEANLIFMGHTHLPGIFSFDPETEQVIQTAPQDTFFDPNKRHLINVGSVGDPRDGDINACYTILDMESRHLSFRRVPFDYEAFRADQLSTGLKHKSWFLKLVDSQVQDVAPMGDMTARPTSLVTGHIARKLPSVTLSPLVNTPTRLASAEKSQNRLAFIGIAALLICFIGLAMMIGSKSDDPEPDPSKNIVEKKDRKPATPEKQTPPVKPIVDPTPDKPDPPSIVGIDKPDPVVPDPPDPVPDTNPDPDPNVDVPPAVAQGDILNLLSDAFFDRDLEKTATLAKQISSDDGDLKELTEKFLNADKTILESFRPDIGKTVEINFTKGGKRMVRIEKISDTNLTCSTVISGKRAVREFTSTDFHLFFRINRLAPDQNDPIRYLYGGIEAAHAGVYSVTLTSLSKIEPNLRAALKESFVKHVVASGHRDLEVLLTEFDIPVVAGDLVKTIDDIWSSPVDLEATKSLPGKIELIRKKLSEAEAASHPFDKQLAELQEAFTAGYRRGLVAEFYENRGHQGKPVATRIDPTIDFAWEEEAPHPDVEKDSFSTTWTGYIRPETSGPHGFSISVDDQGSVDFIKSKSSKIEGSYVETFELDLEAGVYYSFVFKHIEGWGRASAKFRWKPPGETSYDIVPKEVLFHTPPSQ